MNHLLILADVAPSTGAGIIAAFISGFTALTLLVTAITGLVLARTASRKAAEESRRAARAIAAQLERDTQAAVQLKVIHTLTNATLTTALQGELNATRRELVMWRALVMRDGETAESVAAMAEVQQRVDEMTARMADRATQGAEVLKQGVVENDRRK